MSAPSFFENPQVFRNWLAINARTASELIVGFHKVNSGRPSMSWSESVDEALCFGWIDGVRKRIDDESYQIRFTPRKPTSIWSAVNIAKIAALQAEGRMTAAGMTAFDFRKDAKSAIYSHEQPVTAELSAQELIEFKKEKAAWQFFEKTPPSYKKRILHWIATAKKAETRASRFATLLSACVEGKRLG